MTISTKPIAQLIIDACAGTSNVTRTNGTGSQLRLRNSTPPRRAVPLRSASDWVGEGACGEELDDMARNLVVEQGAEELRHHGVERCGAFHVREMTSPLQHLEPAAGNRRLHATRILQRGDHVFVADDDQRWHVDSRECWSRIGPRDQRFG